METAAAILTKLAFEENDQLRSQLNAFNLITAKGVEEVILPLYRHILAQLRAQEASGAGAGPSPAHPAL